MDSVVCFCFIDRRFVLRDTGSVFAMVRGRELLSILPFSSL